MSHNLVCLASTKGNQILEKSCTYVIAFAQDYGVMPCAGRTYTTRISAQAAQKTSHSKARWRAFEWLVY
jgi:hypothetical protein